MPQLLSPCATTTEAQTPRACVPQQEKAPKGEAQTLELESSPNSLQLEKNLCSSEDPTYKRLKIKENLWKKT